jgi:hypothetical protein
MPSRWCSGSKSFDDLKTNLTALPIILEIKRQTELVARMRAENIPDFFDEFFFFAIEDKPKE